ncbi:phosphatidylinositol 3,4,5-trisphosphate 5-phosphatase 2B-like [Schistocerca gregaria]|uniref:phosphatidylinositol 3,4,5-trisphosphate 5-phosphatase 2B-like n=1 Tax=Schistocerca gregaria TaxID=7010 RepID=UPI00211ED801|nr:phosphatidylinositol 3,4,5-trisphosphate 5-phosphatase 2B-like [Schistocerca gregaria]
MEAYFFEWNQVMFWTACLSSLVVFWLIFAFVRRVGNTLNHESLAEKGNLPINLRFEHLKDQWTFLMKKYKLSESTVPRWHFCVFDRFDLQIFVGTWNMGNSVPPNCDVIRTWFACEAGGTGTSPNGSCARLQHDVIIVGVQECAYYPEKQSCENHWFNLLKKTLGSEFTMIACISLRKSIRTGVFVRKLWTPCIDAIQADMHSTTFPVFWRKGGIGVHLKLLGTDLCFLNCHLSAHSSRTLTRNSELRRLFGRIKLGRRNCDISNQFHHIWVFGDLNYRVLTDWNHCDRLISARDWQTLESYDQLIQEQKKEKILYDFIEGPLNFSPTFKVARGSPDCYSSQRIPSWCDRILVHSLPNCSLRTNNYARAKSIASSDHTPVYATFTCSIPPSRVLHQHRDYVKTHSHDEKSTDVPALRHARPFRLIFTQLVLEMTEHACTDMYPEFRPAVAFASPVISGDCEATAATNADLFTYFWDSTITLRTEPICAHLLAVSHLYIHIRDQSSAGASSANVALAVLALQTPFRSPQTFAAPAINCGVKFGTISGCFHIKC